MEKSNKEVMKTTDLIKNKRVLLLTRMKSDFKDLQKNENFLNTPVYLLSVLASSLGAVSVTFDPEGDFDIVISQYSGDELVDEKTISGRMAQKHTIVEFSWDGLGGRWFSDRVVMDGEVYETQDHDEINGYKVDIGPYSPHKNIRDESFKDPCAMDPEIVLKNLTDKLNLDPETILKTITDKLNDKDSPFTNQPESFVFKNTSDVADFLSSDDETVTSEDVDELIKNGKLIDKVEDRLLKIVESHPITKKMPEELKKDSVYEEAQKLCEELLSGNRGVDKQ